MKKTSETKTNTTTTIEVVELAEIKKFAKTISQKTAQNIVSFIAKHKNPTASEIAQGLHIPLSTAQYNLKALVKAKIVEDTSFHYSSKGKEVIHYELAKKVIVIVPEKEPSVLAQLTTILPGIGIVGAIGALGLAVQWIVKQGFLGAKKGVELASGEQFVTAQAPAMLEQAQDATAITQQVASQDSSLFFGMLIGVGLILLSTSLFWYLKKTIRK